ASLTTDPPNLRDSTPPSRSISPIFFQPMQDHSTSEDDHSDDFCGDGENEMHQLKFNILSQRWKM
ncbi:22052_t:CDS:1, partial [Entrophospora sp. SA101]